MTNKFKKRVRESSRKFGTPYQAAFHQLTRGKGSLSAAEKAVIGRFGPEGPEIVQRIIEQVRTENPDLEDLDVMEDMVTEKAMAEMREKGLMGDEEDEVVLDDNFWHWAPLSSGFLRKSVETYEIPDVGKVEHVVVECPYEAGSRNWMPMGDHTTGIKAVVDTAQEDGVVRMTGKPRRVIFPRLVETEDGLIDGTGETIEERIASVLEAVRERGWDNLKPDEHEWRALWMEFRCDGGGKEHIIAGMPQEWSAEMVQTMVMLPMEDGV